MENLYTLLSLLSFLGLAVSVVGTVVQLVRRRDATRPAVAVLVSWFLLGTSVSLHEFGMSLDSVWFLLVLLVLSGFGVSCMGMFVTWLQKPPMSVDPFWKIGGRGFGRMSLFSYSVAMLIWAVAFVIVIFAMHVFS